MRLYIKTIQNLGGFDHTSRSEYRIVLYWYSGKYPKVRNTMLITYYDHGNNAEYESHYEITYGKFQNEAWDNALWELLDDVVYQYGSIGTVNVDVPYVFDNETNSFQPAFFKNNAKVL